VQFVVILTTTEILILDTAHHAVAAVVHDQQRHVRFLLGKRCQLAQVKAQAAVAHQPHHLALRVGNRGADRHRQPHTNRPRQRMNVHQRAVSAEQTAAPQAAGNGDIPHQQAVVRQRLFNRIVELRIRPALLAQPLLCCCHRLLDLPIPLGIAPFAPLRFVRQRRQQHRTVGDQGVIHQIVTARRRRIDINLHAGMRQLERP